MSEHALAKAARLAFWSRPVEPEPLGGGITNTNFVVREPATLKRIVPLIHTCHTEIPKHFRGPALVFWPFHVCRNYVTIASEGNSRKMDTLSRFLDINDDLKEAVGEIKLVFGHNDLLAANFIDDGTRLWLVDWDYAGYNAAIFDLANLSSNNQLSPEQEDWLLETYNQQPVTDILRRRLAAMKCASLLRETLWSIVPRSTRPSTSTTWATQRRISLALSAPLRPFKACPERLAAISPTTRYLFLQEAAEIAAFPVERPSHLLAVKTLRRQ